MTTTLSRPAPTNAAGAPVRKPARPGEQKYQRLQLVLFAAGAVLMPLGILLICLGWYGTAHAHYDYDQRTYLISGGLLGLGLTFFGGFLYFGAWLARVAADQRESGRQLADTILVLADTLSRQSSASAGLGAGGPSDLGAVAVLAGSGTTVHRRDCALIAHRDDLRVPDGSETGLTTCRVCRPTLV
jgi:hypothetical protein